MFSVCGLEEKGYTSQRGAIKARGSQADTPSLCYSPLPYPQSSVAAQCTHRLPSLNLGWVPAQGPILLGKTVLWELEEESWGLLHLSS